MKKIYNWSVIQKFYDEGNAWRDIISNFGCSSNSIAKAIKRGDLKMRSKSEAIKIAHIKYANMYIPSDETKRKISISRKKYLDENPDKVPYILNHYTNGISYPEKYFKEVFENECIPLKHHKQIKCYQLDFYNDEKMIDVEVDGDQHHLDKRIVESDIRRTKFLEEQGWSVFRIKWSDYQKLSYKEKCEVINEIKRLLDKNMQP